MSGNVFEIEFGSVRTPGVVVKVTFGVFLVGFEVAVRPVAGIFRTCVVVGADFSRWLAPKPVFGVAL